MLCESPITIDSYMIKVQPLCTTNTTRWFILTVSQFMYLKEEGGDLMRWDMVWDVIVSDSGQLGCVAQY